jgi:hypothetical protein
MIAAAVQALPTLDAALACGAAGVSVIPINHATKRPLGSALPTNPDGEPTWKPFMSRIASSVEIAGWFRTHATRAFAAVCGAISGGLCAIDFDDPRFYRQWYATAGELTAGLVVQRSGRRGGGYHVLFRCPNPGTNDKLAWVEDANEEQGRRVAVETRAEGGYLVLAPSLHPDGRYDLLRGDLAAIPTITQEHADILLSLARDLDEMPVTKHQLDRAPTSAHHRATANGQGGVIDAFNDTYDAAAILEQHGYAETVGGRYKRPGGKSGSVYVRDGRSFHHSSNDPLSDGYWHRPFDLFCQFDHNGDCRNAVRAAARLLNLTPTKPTAQPKASDPVREALTTPPPPGAAEELRLYMRDVIEGRIFNVPFPWPAVTAATQALQPGSFTLIGGDPGVGKTLTLLQCLQEWRTKYNPAAFFVEKNRLFYTRRLIAQLTGNAHFLNVGWVHDNPAAWDAAFAEHASAIDSISPHLWTKPRGKLSLDLVLGWIRDRAKDGHRVIIVDPITAVDPGAERWTKENDFVQAAQEIIGDAGVSLLLSTHPKQASGRTGGTTSGHDAAGGAAYFRFVDTMIWWTRAKQPRKVMVNHPIGGQMLASASIFGRLLKTREGYGAGWEIAYGFRDLKYTEYGVVVKDVKDKAEDLPGDDMVDPYPPSRPVVSAPRAHQSLDLEDDA